MKPFIYNNFLNQTEQILLNNYFMIRHINNITSFDELSENLNADTSFYGDPLSESFLVSKKKSIQKETKLNLLPTFSYWRMDTHNANLIEHTNREACEISVTIQVTSSGEPWPIYVDNKAYNLKNGDALIYDGLNNSHYRENFQGDHSANLYLHYVNANGKFKEHHLDKRKFFGNLQVAQKI